MALKFARLTRPAIRAMQPGEGITEHGITAEKQATGDVRYSVNVMVDGERIHRVIGRESDGCTRAQAEEAIENFKTEARHGRLDLPKARKLHRSFAEAAEEYLTRLESSGGKNLRNKRRHLRQRLVPYFGNQRLDKITEFGLRQYRKHREGQGVRPATVNRELATLLHLMNRAASKDWGWIKPEAKPAIPRAAEARKQINILTPDQDEKLLRAAVADQDPDAWLFVLFALNAPMRHGEILARRYDELDAPNCRLWIDKAKAGERIQPITPALRDALVKQRAMVDDPDGWIFPSRTKQAKGPHRRSMAKTFLRVVVRAKLDPTRITPHVLRHTGISRLLMAGTDIRTAQTISGHKTTAMLMHYSHVLGTHVDNAMGVLNRTIPGTVTPELHTADESGAANDAAPKAISA